MEPPAESTVLGLDLGAEDEELLCSALQTFLLTRTEAELQSGMELM